LERLEAEREFLRKQIEVKGEQIKRPHRAREKLTASFPTTDSVDVGAGTLLRRSCSADLYKISADSRLWHPLESGRFQKSAQSEGTSAGCSYHITQ
jgi:hypothetical protein